MCDIMKFYISCSLVINGNKVFYSLHCDPAKLHLLRKRAGLILHWVVQT